MLDELVLGGEVQETSKKNVLKAIAAQDLLQEVCLTRSTRIYCLHETWLMININSRNGRSTF